MRQLLIPHEPTDESNYLTDSPSTSIISFHKVIDGLVKISNEDQVAYRAAYAKALVEAVSEVPELYHGTTSHQVIEDNIDLIRTLLSDLFPTALTENEIKAVSLPFQNFHFNFTKRFEKILKRAGSDFRFNFRDFDKDTFYIYSCCLIMNKVYKEDFDISRPIFYDIPNEKGIVRHYRITYNADFIDILPTENSIEITEDDIKLLKDNFDNPRLWREKFPPNSWVSKGFGIITLTDVTLENSISIIKSSIIKRTDVRKYDKEMLQVFDSIFNIPNLKTGISLLDNFDYKFIRLKNTVPFSSLFLLAEENEDTRNFFQEIKNHQGIYCITDVQKLVDKEPSNSFYQFLKANQIASFILAPIKENQYFRGYIEISSEIPYALNTVNANKIYEFLPLVNDAVERFVLEIENELIAIIQNEFTTIHSSVYWSFIEKAKTIYFQKESRQKIEYSDIIFEDTYPLFAEVDIKSSTYHRQLATREDIQNQLKEIIHVFNVINLSNNNLAFQQRSKEIQLYLNQVQESTFFSEKIIDEFIEQKIHPLFQQLLQQHNHVQLLQTYFETLNPKNSKYYFEREKFDQSLRKINENLIDILDLRQEEIQKIYPHYYERFRSDGIEHNIYAGPSIAPHEIFDPIYIYNLRLWQIQVLIESTLKHNRLIPQLSHPLELTNLILAYDEKVTIRFRLDEKKFDVDGLKDIRYEMVKKRISKARLLNSEERLVQPNTLCIVYLNNNSKSEYLQYVKFLQKKGYLHSNIEEVTLEDLQDLTDVHALRIPINLEATPFDKYFTYMNVVGK